MNYEQCDIPSLLFVALPRIELGFMRSKRIVINQYTKGLCGRAFTSLLLTITLMLIFMKTTTKRITACFASEMESGVNHYHYRSILLQIYKTFNKVQTFFIFLLFLLPFLYMFRKTACLGYPKLLHSRLDIP